MNFNNGICVMCGKPAEIHHHKKGKVFYRSTCYHCGEGVHRYWNSLSHLQRLAYILKLNVRRCQSCSKEFPFNCEIHHKDKDKTNNSFDNLVILCPNCHTLIHCKVR